MFKFYIEHHLYNITSTKPLNQGGSCTYMIQHNALHVQSSRISIAVTLTSMLVSVLAFIQVFRLSFKKTISPAPLDQTNSYLAQC